MQSMYNTLGISAPVYQYGEDILRRGKFARTPGAHMSGGLDKARRTGITKPVPKEF